MIIMRSVFFQAGPMGLGIGNWIIFWQVAQFNLQSLRLSLQPITCSCWQNRLVEWSLTTITRRVSVFSILNRLIERLSYKLFKTSSHFIHFRAQIKPKINFFSKKFCLSLCISNDIWSNQFICRVWAHMFWNIDRIREIWSDLRMEVKASVNLRWECLSASITMG